MNTPTNPEPRRPLRTSDLAAAGAQPRSPDQSPEGADFRKQRPESGQPARAPARAPRSAESEQLEALFPSDAAARYRARWAEIQSGFVDDPRRAVANGDELVAEVMKSLAESFAHERERLEKELSGRSEASTETLRVGLRRDHSFFERLLSL